MNAGEEAINSGFSSSRVASTAIRADSGLSECVHLVLADIAILIAIDQCLDSISEEGYQQLSLLFVRLG